MSRDPSGDIFRAIVKENAAKIRESHETAEQKFKERQKEREKKAEPTVEQLFKEQENL